MERKNGRPVDPHFAAEVERIADAFGRGMADLPLELTPSPEERSLVHSVLTLFARREPLTPAGRP